MVPSARLYNEHFQGAAVRPGPVGMSPNNVGSRCYYLLIREASMPQHALWQSRPVFPSSTFRDMRAQRGYLRWGAGAVSASPRESQERTAGGSIHEKNSSSNHLGGGRNRPVGPAVGADPGRRPRATANTSKEPPCGLAQ